MTTRLTVKSVQRAVSDVTGVRVADMLGPHRTKGVTRARHIAMWMAKRHCPHASYPEIGRQFRRDHTTILHAVNKIEAEIADVGMDSEIEDIELVLTSIRRALDGLSTVGGLDPMKIAARVLKAQGVSRLTHAEIRCLAGYAIEKEGINPSCNDGPIDAAIAVPMLPGAEALIGATRRVVRAHRDFQTARYGRGEGTATTALATAVNELHEAYLDLAAPVVFNPVFKSASNAPRKEAAHG